MKFLFVVPPLVGHVNPTISVAAALRARGHRVAWVGHPDPVRPLLPADALLFALPPDTDPARSRAVAAAARTARGAAALKLLWEDFLVPLAHQMRPGVDAAVREFAPDVLVVDQQALAGGMVAREREIRWATFATTSADIIDPLATLPQVKRWRGNLLSGLGFPASGELSPHLVVVFSTPALIGPVDRYPGHFSFVGPSFGWSGRSDSAVPGSGRVETSSFPFAELRRPCVLVSMGTVNTAACDRFYAVVTAAIRRVQVVLVGDVAAPKNFIVRPHVPQLALLPRVDAVVCHGGHNTTCEALAHGIPLVLAPIKDDQPFIADQVIAAGAGIRVKFGRVQPDGLATAVDRVLTEPAFRAAAHRVRSSFADAGGAAAAASALEAL
ncbi:glycosyltransferase [Skermania piniformis]|uniref:Glycosyltransferase n=1 Tax=Skermania pinensis TaxID=39122 RepID=A0ABX8SHU4_9ACTN|nr:nucleotide disphospho-sugar-binding domain-containing protein [Skermania piniformis]QXQ15256.1 glycosyltransferase [Skermania piniformis]